MSMTWEEAAKVIQGAMDVIKDWKEDDVFVRKSEAYALAIEALKEKDQEIRRWVRTRERRPGREDAGADGRVLAVRGEGDEAYVTVVKWSFCTPKAYPLWRRYPGVG